VRIVSWNCNGAFRRKLEQIDTLHADILVIQECEEPNQSTEDYAAWADQHIWTGNNKNRGLGVFVKGDFSIAALDWPNDGLEQFLPVRINDEFDLLAVWTKQAGGAAFPYIGQFWKYIQVHKSKLTSTTFICGDFNSNNIWDRLGRIWNHSECVSELDEIGFSSLYHLAMNERQGFESRPTFFLHRNLQKPYHIDYAFAHRDQIPLTSAKFQVGEPSDWLQHSDHMPVIIDF
jgi:exonuclease III